MSSGHRRDVYFGNLKLPADPAATVGILKGKSNFISWHSAIRPHLLSHPYSSELILGSWTEPQFSIPSNTDEQISLYEKRKRWHAANTGTCRFIRETLAANVIPFVRTYNTAKVLFFNLVWLYGEDAGIDTQGGPPAPINMMSTKRGRESLLAVLEARTTLEHLPRPHVTFSLPFPTATTSIQNASSSPSVAELKAPSDNSKTQHPISQSTPATDNIEERLARIFEHVRATSLATIHETEDPHPGRRIRISSGYAVGYDLDHGHDRPQGSVSPLSLSQSSSLSRSDGEYDDYQHQHHDTRIKNPLPRPEQHLRREEKEEEEDFEPDSTPSKTSASITSIMKTIKSTKPRKRDRFAFSFPLRRLNTDKAKENGTGK